MWEKAGKSRELQEKTGKFRKIRANKGKCGNLLFSAAIRLSWKQHSMEVSKQNLVWKQIDTQKCVLQNLKQGRNGSAVSK